MKSNKGAPKQTRWTGEDRDRLKLALKLARNPQSTEDWEWIARQVGDDRHNAGECKEEATKKLGWEPAHSKGGEDEGKLFFETLFHQDDDSSEFELDPSDSMLLALRSPNQKAKTRRRPFVPKVLNNTILECSTHAEKEARPKKRRKMNGDGDEPDQNSDDSDDGGGKELGETN